MKLKVFNTIVRFNSIDMVDYFFWQKNFIKMLFHNKAMLQNIAFIISIWMILNLYSNISTTMFSFSTFPIWGFFSYSFFSRNTHFKPCFFATSAIFQFSFMFIRKNHKSLSFRKIMLFTKKAKMFSVSIIMFSYIFYEHFINVVKLNKFFNVNEYFFGHNCMI